MPPAPLSAGAEAWEKTAVFAHPCSKFAMKLEPAQWAAGMSFLQGRAMPAARRPRPLRRPSQSAPRPLAARQRDRQPHRPCRRLRPPAASRAATHRMPAPFPRRARNPPAAGSAGAGRAHQGNAEGGAAPSHGGMAPCGHSPAGQAAQHGAALCVQGRHASDGPACATVAALSARSSKCACGIKSIKAGAPPPPLGQGQHPMACAAALHAMLCDARLPGGEG